MSAPELSDVLQEALRILFVAGLPIVIALALAGLFTSAIQAVTSTPDSATIYAGRLIALVVVLYLFLPGVSQMVLALCNMVFH